MTAADHIRNPQNRIRVAWALLIATLIGWPTTHALMLITKPEGATSWVFHLLLALSWLAITFTALDILATTDVRREQDDDENSR